MSENLGADDSSGGSAASTAGEESKVRYMVVPPLQIAGNIPLARLNMAGWADANKDSYTCKVCKKQVRLSLSELLIFPQVDADKDLFQFALVVPPHRSGGAFSVELCKGAGTRVLRNYERPTIVRSMDRSQVPTADQQEQEESPTATAAPPLTPGEIANREEVKKRVAGLSPEMAEKRYDYLLARPISELTDEEYAERIALLERLTAKEEPKKG